MSYRPIVLIILDGWGLSPSWGGNALVMNNPREIDRLWRTYPHLILQALSVTHQDKTASVAESRLGHAMIGAGRQIESTFNHIQDQIENNQFYRNQILNDAFDWAQKNNSNVHLLGLISEGGIHSHLSHLMALLNLAARKHFKRVFIDAITDGTDSGSTDALSFVEKIENKMHNLRLGEFSSIAGRFFAMDRDEHFNRTSQYYKLLVEGKGDQKNNIKEAITDAYKNGLNDEFIKPTLLETRNGKIATIQKNDAVICFNFREERMRQLVNFFINDKFRIGFRRPRQIEDLYFVGFIDYQKDLPLKVAFPQKIYKNTLSEIFSHHKLKQLKIAESEKSTHVTTFFNGGQDEAFTGEERKIISSPDVESYDLAPEMSAEALTKTLIQAIKTKKYDFILVNFANVDMVAHTGNILAVGQAVQVLDKCIKQIVELNLKMGGATLITADHGNAEQMVSTKSMRHQERETLHTLNPVPFILVAQDQEKDLLKRANGVNAQVLAQIISAKNSLADIAPTILSLLHLPKPTEMTGRSLLNILE